MTFQHGYKSGRQVISAGVKFVESVVESCDKGKSTIGICMDLSKAFDRVKYYILLEELQYLGIYKII